MKRSIYCSLLMSAMMSVVAAEETRQVDKHEHGVGAVSYTHLTLPTTWGV